jgi:hypothetical protein
MMSSWRKRLLLIFFLVDSLAVFGIWALNLANNAFPNGLLQVSVEAAIPLLHLMAEFLMGGLTLVGVIGFWRGESWGKGLTMFGLGMFAYAAMNSLGWAIPNDPLQGIPMAITLLVILLALPALLKDQAS